MSIFLNITICRLVLLSLLAIGLSAMGGGGDNSPMVFNIPTHPLIGPSTSTVVSPVAVDITWSNQNPACAFNCNHALDPSSLAVKLDATTANVDVSRQFTVDPTGFRATAILTLALGDHTLDASGTLLPTPGVLGSAGRPGHPTSGHTSFTVVQHPLTFDPPTVSLNVGEAATVTVIAGQTPTAPVNVFLVPDLETANVVRLGTQPSNAPDTITIQPPSTSAVETITGNLPGTTTIFASAASQATGSMTVTVFPLPKPGALDPTHGVVGQDIRISGANFNPSQVVTVDQSRVPFSFVNQGEIHFRIPQISAGAHSVAVQGQGSLGLTVDAGPLTVSPSPFVVTIGQAAPLMVTLPAAAPPPNGVSLSLTASPSNLALIGPLPPVPTDNTSTSTSITGQALGSGVLQVSGTGYTTLAVPLTIPVPSFSLSLAGPNQDVHFGDNASFTVTLTPVNGFTGTVALSTPNQPSLTQAGWTFSPSSSIDASSNSLSRTLHGTIIPSLFSPGPNRAAVQGMAANGLQASAIGTLTVGHSQGDFTHVYPQPQVPAAAQTDCVDGTAHVHISFTSFGTNDFRVRFTRMDLPGMPATADTPAVFFLYSQQHCRIGIALNGVGLQQVVSLFNLGFTAAPGWDIRNAHSLPANALRQQYWFSQDESLLVAIRVIGQTPDSRLPPGTQSGTIWDYGALLIDPVTGSQVGTGQQFSSLTLVADIKEQQAEANGTQFNMNQNGMLSDPDPDPNQAAPVIADIYKIELVRNPASGALQAEGTFRILNGQLDGTTFEQESAAHPDHFGKFVLPVP